MTNTQTDEHREEILETWCNVLRCNTCSCKLGYSNKFTPTQYEMICVDCLVKAFRKTRGLE